MSSDDGIRVELDTMLKNAGKFQLSGLDKRFSVKGERPSSASLRETDGVPTKSASAPATPAPALEREVRPHSAKGHRRMPLPRDGSDFWNPVIKEDDREDDKLKAAVGLTARSGNSS
jgi:hypothetical protein